MKKIILVTKSQIRHQKFLSFALSHLSGHKIYPFVQGDFNEKKLPEIWLSFCKYKLATSFHYCFNFKIF